MASSVVMHTLLASSVVGRTKLNQNLTSNYSLHFHRRSPNMLVVRSMAEEGQKEEVTPNTPTPTPSLSSSQTNPISTPTPTPIPTPKKSSGFRDVLAFSGPAPERINGRLAMIGFVTAMAVELANGQDVFAQISNGGAQWFIGTSVVLSLASLIPLLKGVSVESKSNGLMNSNAELWNGRFAMLGIVALAFTEYVTGGALV